MTNNKAISVDYYFHGKYVFSYLSIKSASEYLNIDKSFITKALREETEYQGHSFKYNMKTNPYIVTTALIRAISSMSLTQVKQSNKEYYVNKITNKVKAIIDEFGEELITDENVFDVNIVTNNDIIDIISAVLEERFV